MDKVNQSDDGEAYQAMSPEKEKSFVVLTS